MEGEGVRSCTFFSTLLPGDAFSFEVDAVGEDGRATISGAACGFRVKNPKTMVDIVVLCVAGIAQRG